ncbi:docking protein 2 isoform X2 [Tiliqua scincoides]|uniref:docking protein 2 isoform X2 n=1 Tax=Tiliqua scincoides TaxID=71010 RepID=UPI00346282D9
MEEAVVRQGLLYLQQQQTFGKKWRKFWGVLYRESACATARVELLEGSGPPSMERSRRAESGRRLIKLTDCVYVGEAKGEASSPKETVPFLLETTEKCYLLAAEKAEAEGWILELCTLAFSRSKEAWNKMLEAKLLKGTDASSLSMAENSLYSPPCKGAAAFGTRFPVAVRATQASEHCRLWGRFLLCATADALELSSVQTGGMLYTWPYKFLRRFGHDKVMFSFEAGRRCASGEGCFEFATKQGHEIIQIIEAAINAHRDLGANGSPAASSSTSLLTRAKPDEAGAPEEELPLSHATSTKSLSLEPGWQRKPPKGKAVKPTASCPLSSTKGVYMVLSDAHPSHEPQYGPGVLECAGKIPLPQVKIMPESEYAEPFDTLSRPGVGTEGNCPLCSSEKASTLPVSLRGRTGVPGLDPAQVGPEHIYDDPEALVHLVYDEPQEIKGDAWKLRATAEDPVGHEYPYNPCLDDYAVPKMVGPAQLPLPGQDKSRPEENAGGSMILKLRKMMNTP